MSTNQEITVITPRDVAEVKSLSLDLAKSSLMAADMKSKPENVMVAILTGAELGIGPMQALRGIHVIEGKAALSADLIAALCLRRRDVCEYLTPTEMTAETCTYVTRRVNAPREVTMTVTMKEFKAAGIDMGHKGQKDNWRKFPAAMLRARCVSAICRAVYPDLVAGIYDADSGELADVVEQEREVNATPTPSAAPEVKTSATNALKQQVLQRAKKEKKKDEPEDAVVVPPTPPTPAPATSSAPPIDCLRFGPAKGKKLTECSDLELVDAHKVATENIAKATGKEPWFLSAREGLEAIDMELDFRTKTKPEAAAEPGSEG